MENMDFKLPGKSDRHLIRPAVLAGVVASGNLEVLLEPADLANVCQVHVRTKASGFAEIWSAVLNDFARRHDLANIRVSINDGGATPAVVSLRLDQAMEDFLGKAP